MHTYYPVQNSTPSQSKTQHKTRYTEADRKEDVEFNSLSPEKTLWTKHLGQKIVQYLINETSLTWEAFAWQRIPSFLQSNSLQNEEDYTDYISYRGLISIIYKVLEKLEIKKTNNPIKNEMQIWQRILKKWI